MINICCALCTHTRARIFNLPCGEYTLKLIGKFEMPLEEPVTLSVSSSISLRIDKKSINFLPLQCRNSPYSVGPLINWRISGRLVTIPFPLGRKSLKIQSKICFFFLSIFRILAFFSVWGSTNFPSYFKERPWNFCRLVSYLIRPWYKYSTIKDWTHAQTCEPAGLLSIHTYSPAQYETS